MMGESHDTCPARVFFSRFYLVGKLVCFPPIMASSLRCLSDWTGLPAYVPCLLASRQRFSNELDKVMFHGCANGTSFMGNCYMHEIDRFSLLS